MFGIEGRRLGALDRQGDERKQHGHKDELAGQTRSVHESSMLGFNAGSGFRRRRMKKVRHSMNAHRMPDLTSVQSISQA
jgi:hypothetical protein